MSKRYEIEFLEIGTDEKNVHFMVKSLSSYTPMEIIQTVMSFTTSEILARLPEVKKEVMERAILVGQILHQYREQGKY